MTSLEKMLKRVEFNQKNKLRAYDGLTPLELPVELMDEKEYNDYLRKIKQKSVADMLNDACVILNASKNPYARKRVYKDEPRCKKVNIVGLETAKEKVKKETSKTFKEAVNELKENLEKEMKKSSQETSKVKEETKKATNSNAAKETQKTKAEKQKSTEVKDEPRCKKVNIIGLGPLQEETKKATNINATEEPVKETKEEMKKSSQETPKAEKQKSTEVKEESVKETQKTKEVKEPEDEKITEIKNILASLYSEIKDFNIKPLITEYDKLTAGKKKEAICELLKGFVASIAKEQNINFNDIVNFSCDIPSLANANNKRNYITMLKCLKDSITQKKYNISNKICEKIDIEIANQITRNKKKLMTMLKESEDMTFTEDNIDEFITTIKAILNQIENGIPFEKIEECRKSDNDKGEQVVNEEFDETDSNSNEEEPIFMSSEQLEEVNQTINEIISGM